MNVGKRKPQLLLWPITKDTDNPVNQSKLDINPCRRRKARENGRERVAIGFGFTSDWLRKWREFFKPITKRGNAKPNQTRITFGENCSDTTTSVYNSYDGPNTNFVAVYIIGDRDDQDRAVALSESWSKRTVSSAFNYVSVGISYLDQNFLLQRLW